MALSTTSPQIDDFLDIFGLKGKQVRSFQLKAAVGKLVILTVEYLTDEIEFGKLVTIVRKYHLEEIEQKYIVKSGQGYICDSVIQEMTTKRKEAQPMNNELAKAVLKALSSMNIDAEMIPYHEDSGD